MTEVTMRKKILGHSFFSWINILRHAGIFSTATLRKQRLDRMID